MLHAIQSALDNVNEQVLYLNPVVNIERRFCLTHGCSLKEQQSDIVSLADVCRNGIWVGVRC